MSIALFMIFAGYLLVYAGIKGKPYLEVLRGNF